MWKADISINLTYIKEHASVEEIKYGILPYKEIEEAELDEIWGCVESKKNKRWLWLAIEHVALKISAYTFGKGKDYMLRQFRELIAPFNISLFYTDD